MRLLIVPDGAQCATAPSWWHDGFSARFVLGITERARKPSTFLASILQRSFQSIHLNGAFREYFRH